MASLLDVVNAGGRRAPVVTYAPGRQVAPTQRTTRPLPRPRPSERQRPSGSWGEFSERLASTPEAQRKAQEEAEPEQEGFWGSDFGRGLGFVVNNPVTRVVTTPLNYLQMGGRAITLGLEELREALPEGPEWLDKMPPLGAAGLFARIDPDRTEQDTRSNWNKVVSPNTTYGYGEIMDLTGNKNVDRLLGLGGDVALDPLTYVGNAGSRVVTGASHATQAADELRLATRALDAAQEAGKAKKITQAQQRLARAEDYVARAPEMGTPTIHQQMPRTRAERVEFISRLEGTPEGRQIINEFGGELQRAGARGFHTASPALKEALGIQAPGLRVRGMTTPIPGTRTISSGISSAGGRLRAGGNVGLGRLPERVRNLRVPVELEESFAVLSREASGDVLLAATDVASRNRIRLGTGAQRARGGRRIVNMVRKGFKGKSQNDIRRLVREAETSPEPNIINEIAAGILETYENITGRKIDPQYKRDPNTYFPHLLDPKWRRALAAAAKKGDKAALDFIDATGLHQDELLEEGAFYVDNLLQGSGFLERARKLGTNIDGSPRTIKVAGKEITFEADDLDHINAKLREAFPTWRGDFYDTDPTRVLEAYNSSLARQAGRDLAKQELVTNQNPLARVNEGDLLRTQQAMDEALSQQGAAPLLATAQGKYDPTQPLPDIADRPVVPGSAEDKARRAAVMETLGDIETARTPEEMAAASQALDVLPAPAERFGDVDPNEFFVTTKGTAATAARDADAKRAATYARAATAETRKAEEAVRAGVAEVREELVSPLRTRVAELKKEVTAINRKLRTWAKKISDFGPLTADNFDEIMLIESKIKSEIANIEAKIRRTRGQYKGRATRAQRKAENALKQSLDRLRKIRDGIAKNVREAPARMQEEYNTRLAALDRPVEEAELVLARRESMVGPAPHGQAVVDWAEKVVQAAPRTLDEPVVVEARQKVGAANDKIKRALALPPEGAAGRPKVAEAQETLKKATPWVKRLQGRVRDANEKIRAAREIIDTHRAQQTDVPLVGKTPINEMASGKLPPAVVSAEREIVAQQQLLREIDEKLQPLLEQIRLANETINPVRQPNARLTPRAQKMIAEAEADLAQYKPIVDAAAGPKMTAYEVAQDEIKRLEDSLPDMPRSRAERAQRKLDRLRKDFAPGGKFAREKRARTILDESRAHTERVKGFTTKEAEALKRAKAERLSRQEAIIWATRGKTSRHITAPGQPASQLEQMGWRAGEGRFPESIVGGEGFPEGQNIPQGAAWSQTERPAITDVVGGQVSPGGETVLAPGEVNRPRPVPTPRTEVEALQSLEGQIQYGSPAQQATRIPLKQAEQDLRDAATRAPHEIAAEKARIATEMGKEADAAVGGDVLKTQTFSNLAGDLVDKGRLVRKRDELTALRNRLNKANPKYLKSDLGKTIDEIESIAKANPLLDDDTLTKTESVLQTHRQELQRIGDTRLRVSDLDRVAADAANGKLGDVMIASVHDNWRIGHEGPLQPGDILISTELHKKLNNLFELHRQPQALGRVFNAFTNLFKTYATLTPGFFVRNTIGGVFMNTADGVALSAQAEGAKLWQTFVSPKTDPNWLDNQPRRVQDAFAAAFASGAGGRFEDAGILARTNSRAYNMLSSNPATRWGQRLGTRVEGAMRLGMALDSVDMGMDVSEALGRISRVHFDYAQVSQLDETMKRIIPFWTFMSRNLPLQIQEQWTNPRVYSYYDHLVQNFSLPDEEFTPDYWKRQGAWRTPLSIGGSPIYAQPDLGFTRVQSDIQMLGDTLSGKNAGALFSQANPAIGATLDFLNKRDSFYDRAFDENTDYTKQTGLVGTPLTTIAGILGQTNEAGQVSDNFTNYLSSMIPTLNQVQRLLPEASGAETTADTWAKRARYLGVPTQLLTPAAQDSEYWRQWRAMQDEYKRQQAMALEAAS